jgi:hypothetical protein
MFCLPVSGLRVVIGPPTGVEDLLLQETRLCDVTLALTLIGRLTHVVGKETENWGDLTLTDVEALLLLLHQITVGDLVRAETRCAVATCGAPADVSFRIGQYLASNTPRFPRGVAKSEVEGWFHFGGEATKFRLPTAHDLALMDHNPQAYRELVQRCIEPGGVPAAVRRRIENAMEALAPRLSRPLRGECPECQAKMDSYFNVVEFVLRELRDQAASIYQDVHLLAYHYKWTEQMILELPRNRRMQYAETIRNQGRAA